MPDEPRAAARELGVEVPDLFLLRGVDEGGQYKALVSGNSDVQKISAAILHRLNGGSVAESLKQLSDEPREDPEDRPEGWPPDDWTDKEAWDAWMAERAMHPEWPEVRNGPQDWVYAIAAGGVALAALVKAATPHLNLRARINLAKWLVERAEQRGYHPDPVAVLKAFKRGAHDEEPSTDPSSSEQELPRGGREEPGVSTPCLRRALGEWPSATRRSSEPSTKRGLSPSCRPSCVC